MNATSNTRDSGPTRPRVVVIGASSGIGRCIGIGLVRQGYEVALLGRRTDRLDDAVSEAGAGAVAVTCDVRDGPRRAPPPSNRHATRSAAPTASSTVSESGL